jgi:hypothetical protein
MICSDSSGNLEDSTIKTDKKNVEIGGELEIKSTGTNALIVGGNIKGKSLTLGDSTTPILYTRIVRSEYLLIRHSETSTHTLNFTPSTPDTNYIVIPTIYNNNGARSGKLYACVTEKTTSSVTVKVTSGEQNVDGFYIEVLIIGYK